MIQGLPSLTTWSTAIGHTIHSPVVGNFLGTFQFNDRRLTSYNIVDCEFRPIKLGAVKVSATPGGMLFVKMGMPAAFGDWPLA